MDGDNQIAGNASLTAEEDGQATEEADFCLDQPLTEPTPVGSGEEHAQATSSNTSGHPEGVISSTSNEEHLEVYMLSGTDLGDYDALAEFMTGDLGGTSSGDQPEDELYGGLGNDSILVNTSQPSQESAPGDWMALTQMDPKTSESAPGTPNLTGLDGNAQGLTLLLAGTSGILPAQRFVPGTDAHRQMVRSRVRSLSAPSHDDTTPVERQKSASRSDQSGSGVESGHESEDFSDDERRRVAPGQRVDELPPNAECTSYSGLDLRPIEDKRRVIQNSTSNTCPKDLDHLYSTVKISPIRVPSGSPPAGSFPVATQHPADDVVFGPAQARNVAAWRQRGHAYMPLLDAAVHEDATLLMWTERSRAAWRRTLQACADCGWRCPVSNCTEGANGKRWEARVRRQDGTHAQEHPDRDSCFRDPWICHHMARGWSRLFLCRDGNCDRVFCTKRNLLAHYRDVHTRGTELGPLEAAHQEAAMRRRWGREPTWGSFRPWLPWPGLGERPEAWERRQEGEHDEEYDSSSDTPAKANIDSPSDATVRRKVTGSTPGPSTRVRAPGTCSENEDSSPAELLNSKRKRVTSSHMTITECQMPTKKKTPDQPTKRARSEGGQDIRARLTSTSAKTNPKRSSPGRTARHPGRGSNPSAGGPREQDTPRNSRSRTPVQDTLERWQEVEWVELGNASPRTMGRRTSRTVRRLVDAIEGSVDALRHLTRGANPENASATEAHKYAVALNQEVMAAAHGIHVVARGLEKEITLPKDAQRASHLYKDCLDSGDQDHLQMGANLAAQDAASAAQETARTKQQLEEVQEKLRKVESQYKSLSQRNNASVDAYKKQRVRLSEAEAENEKYLELMRGQDEEISDLQREVAEAKAREQGQAQKEASRANQVVLQDGEVKVVRAALAALQRGLPPVTLPGMPTTVPETQRQQVSTARRLANSAAADQRVSQPPSAPGPGNTG